MSKTMDPDSDLAALLESPVVERAPETLLPAVMRQVRALPHRRPWLYGSITIVFVITALTAAFLGKAAAERLDLILPPMRSLFALRRLTGLSYQAWLCLGLGVGGVLLAIARRLFQAERGES